MLNIVSAFKGIYHSKELILKLAKNDFWTKYAGSQFGIVWGFVQPIITILVYWFVFDIGFRVAPLNDVPYLLWLMCGLIPWFFFSEALINATNSLMEYSYLVKKIVFKISILPIIRVVSTLFVHLFFLVFIMYVSFLYGFQPNIYNLQIAYYLGCMFFLVLGLSYITGSLIVFFKDLNPLIIIALQFGVWLTPIMWNPEMFNENIKKIIILNPMYYIVEGYRDSLINNVWFWEKPFLTIYYWIVSVIIFLLGIILFKRLKPHFSDIL
ncbi:Teichoic acid translocation permease protein TagG [Paenibacillus sp. CECT 9249]|uniref:ABC transporter permease n=1 Tax=Paenibacillus sp. CECT 9249 TaxID=2845385 RepID=UPI001E3681F3|nr:ABC transporter permease [Paenibacillus sp. CECT 9249]CAH0122350.1 Teichoic acid translocation permease protein TagG [Paenibacillus sp. CECT 9249]